MKTAFKVTALIAGMIVATSCSKDDASPKSTAIPDNIYVSGYVSKTKGILSYATFWNKGTTTTLSSQTNSAGYDIALSSSGVPFVAGFKTNSSSVIEACYWADTTRVPLRGVEGYQSSSSGIYVSGSDIYVCGSFIDPNMAQSFGIYWKNGDAIRYLYYVDGAPNYTDSYTSHIYVSNNNVYVSGYIYNQHTGKNAACFWKDGTITLLTTANTNAYATDVLANNSDIYICGAEENDGGKLVAKYWKNSVETSLTDGTYEAKAERPYISGSDLYICGYEKNSAGKFVAKLWKNGTATSFSDGSTDAKVTDVVVSGSDVYACGYITDSNGGRIPTLWKNGVSSSLSTGYADGLAASIALK